MFKEQPKSQKVLLVASLFILVLLIGWHIFSPFGLLHYYKLKGELITLEAENSALLTENRSLAKELYRLQNDKEYFSEIARKQHGLIKKNEMIFDFSKKK